MERVICFLKGHEYLGIGIEINAFDLGTKKITFCQRCEKEKIIKSNNCKF